MNEQLRIFVPNTEEKKRIITNTKAIICVIEALSLDEQIAIMVILSEYFENKGFNIEESIIKKMNFDS